MLIVQSATPLLLQSPDHPLKIESELARGIKTILLPDVNALLHTPLRQFIPAGLLVTLPLPPLELAMVMVAKWVGMFAEQLAVVPPLVPVQVQFHGPEPVTVDAVPVLQR